MVTGGPLDTRLTGSKMGLSCTFRIVLSTLKENGVLNAVHFSIDQADLIKMTGY